MKQAFIALLLTLPIAVNAQIFRSYIDVNDSVVNKAVDFYISYFDNFKKEGPVDYTAYWPIELCKKFKIPDLAVHAISSDYSTYSFGEQNTIFYAKRIKEQVHIKTILSYKSDDSTNTVFAILNHYIKIPVGENEKFQFISPIELNKNSYRQVQFGNIAYHFPVTATFSPEKAAALQCRLSPILKAWKFDPENITYYFTQTQEEMSAMKGFDYRYGDEQSTPSGISFPEDKLVFSVVTGEDNLHEILHIYFNPRYENSPVNHALIYYMAGGLGHDFQWFIDRMHEYLQKYPETDLSQFDTIEPKDIMLHIDFTILGIICKKIDQKEGVPGLKRLLSYKTVDELFLKEFGIQRKNWGPFLIKLIDGQRN